MLVERPQLFGVIGTWFQVTKRGLVDVEVEDPKEPVSYKHPNLRWFLASQLVRVLRDVTIVDLDELELAEAGPVTG
ncbi:hypothetical protein [Streptomyces sp. C36]|uniref:hypothetical protein n=1 Tax=Streptomyces sp. C36 TaxID=3237122 RepID=UPI0034C5FBE2